MNRKEKNFLMLRLFLCFSFVLTAAHCVTDESNFPPNGLAQPSLTHVWIGAHNRDQDNLRNTRAR